MNILCRIFGHKVILVNGVGGANPCIRKGCDHFSKEIEWPKPPHVIIDDPPRVGSVAIDYVEISKRNRLEAETEYIKVKTELKNLETYSPDINTGICCCPN